MSIAYKNWTETITIFSVTKCEVVVEVDFLDIDYFWVVSDRFELIKYKNRIIQ